MTVQTSLCLHHPGVSSLPERISNSHCTDLLMPLKGEPRGPGRGGTSSHLQILSRKTKQKKAQHKAVGAINRFSVGFPRHLPSAGSSARTHGRAWLAQAPTKALPWHLAPVQCWEGAKDTPLHSWGALGCLFTGSGGFVESRGRAGKCPELHHQLDGGLGPCYPQRNSGGKNCNPWQGAGSILPRLPCSSNTLLGQKKE